MHAHPAPSPWVERFAGLVAPGATVLDVAAGSGRHARFFLQRGHLVTALDRDASALRLLPGAEVVEADIENGPWPLAGRTFGAVVVTNYLWRERFADILGSVAPGGILLWDTFMDGQQHIGRPRNPDFLLRHGELAQVVADAGLTMFCFDEGLLTDGPGAVPAFRQRVCAQRPGEPGR